MGHAGPDDSKRRFVVSFFMADSTFAVYEPPVSNSGFIGGKFLERRKVRDVTKSAHACSSALLSMYASIMICAYIRANMCWCVRARTNVPFARPVALQDENTERFEA